MKKIVAAVAALLVAGAAFADVSFAWKGSAIVGGTTKKLDSVTRKDCLSVAVTTDVAGVVYDMDITNTGAMDLDCFYGWLTFALPVGNLQVTSGKWDARNIERVKQDAGELDGKYFEAHKPGVINGSVAKDSANLTGSDNMATVLAYTLTDVLPGTLMAKFGLVSSDYGKFDSQAGFVGELYFAMDDMFKATVSIRNPIADAFSVGAFVSPLMLDSLKATVGFSFGSLKVNDETKTEMGIDARARYAITEKVAIDGMFNYSKTAISKGANGEDLTSMWYLVGANLQATEDIRFVAAFNSTITDLSAERGAVVSHFVPAVEFNPSEKAKVTVGFDAAWNTAALYSGVIDVSLPIYVNFAL